MTLVSGLTHKRDEGVIAALFGPFLLECMTSKFIQLRAQLQQLLLQVVIARHKIASVNEA